MDSSRLPRKVLAPLAGRPLLYYVVRRLAAALSGTDQVLVATPKSAANDAIEELCQRLGVACCRGPEGDVLARYVIATADLADDALVVRATADNPVYCPRRTAAIIAEHRRSGADYTCIDHLSYVVPEVVSAGALRAMAAMAKDARSREHVTPYFREAAHPFRVLRLPSDWLGLRADIRLTVDTADELDCLARLFASLAIEDPLFPLESAYAYFSRPAESTV